MQTCALQLTTILIFSTLIVETRHTLLLKTALLRQASLPAHLLQICKKHLMRAAQGLTRI